MFTEADLARLEAAAGLGVSVSGQTAQKAETAQTTQDHPADALPDAVSADSAESAVHPEGKDEGTQPRRWRYRRNGDWYKTGEAHAHLQTAEAVAAELGRTLGEVAEVQPLFEREF